MAGRGTAEAGGEPEGRLADVARLPAPGPRMPDWQAALFHVPIPIYLLRVDEGGLAVRFLTGNEAARRITTAETAERFGGTVDEIFPWAPANRVTERCVRVSHSNEPDTFQLPITVGAKRQLFQVRIFPLPDAHLGVAVEDLTERIDLQRRKEEFVTLLSHELRTPLASIRGAMGLLEGGVAGALPESAARMVGMAREGAERLSKMLSDLLDLERLRGGLLPMRSEPISVAELVALATAASTGGARAAGVRVVTTVEEDGGVLGDRERLAQAVTNLLSNAVRFSPSGGVVRVRVWRPDPSRVRVEVADDGRPLHPEDAERIFAPYHAPQSADRARGGLGLAISRFIVEGHGGVVGATSGGEVGATFWFELPVLTNPPR